MQSIKDSFKAKWSKITCEFYTCTPGTFTDLKNEVNEYKKDDSKFSKERNVEAFENTENGKDLSFYGGTPEERRNLKSYIYPDRLAKVRDEVQTDVANLQVPDVRKRVEFHKNRHVFVAERYHNGQRRKSFATRKHKRAPRPTVNIALSMGYNCNIEAKDAAYNCLGGIIFADMLAKNGYAVNIYVVSASIYRHNSKKHAGLTIVKAKDSGDYIDADTLAILASDPRFFRHWVLQHNVILEDQKGFDMELGYGKAPSLEDTRKYCDKAGLQIDFMFGKCFSHKKTVQQVTNAVQQLQDEVDNQLTTA